MEQSNEAPLDLLPEALLEELLAKNSEVIYQVRNQVKEIASYKFRMREKLREIGLLRNLNEVIKSQNHSTTVGIDGTINVIKQLSIDTVAIAAVAVEGLIPPKETGPWSKPRHSIIVMPVPHYNETSNLCTAIMLSYELELATKAPHKVVFLDGSLTTYLIGISQGLYAAGGAGKNETAPKELVDLFHSRLKGMLDDFLEIAESPSHDKIYVGMPKYSSGKCVINYLSKFGFEHQLSNITTKVFSH